MQKRTDYNGVTYFYSEGMYPVRHGFSTRLGGISKAEHTKSLNLGFFRGDKDIIVQKNIERFCEAVDIDAKELVIMPQIHSTKVIEVNRDNCGHALYSPATFEGDALVTNSRGVALGVRVADCVPILLADSGAGVIAAVHAGWRGTVGNIVLETVKKMCFLGASCEDIHVAIGPHIQMKNYEVGEEVAKAVLAAVGEEHLTFAHLRPATEKGKYLCGLGEVNKTLLINAGIPEKNIDLSDECTYEDASLFYSHRRMGEKRGTMMGIVAI
ncbi:MAG: peptidoglycan editing factor PgeF [Clostridia bacterium]|nr:peptidoglycan editing factor PgeF [Clostridia bacterium]MBQ6614702.1 peptidoglycan editing factor PgeF [Clostridia bacterium]